MMNTVKIQVCRTYFKMLAICMHTVSKSHAIFFHEYRLQGTLNFWEALAKQRLICKSFIPLPNICTV